MAVGFRYYDHTNDYQRVSEFLIAHHQPGNLDSNWLEPAWEYMHFHGLLDRPALGKIGIWEDAGQCRRRTDLGLRMVARGRAVADPPDRLPALLPGLVRRARHGDRPAKSGHGRRDPGLRSAVPGRVWRGAALDLTPRQAKA